MEPEILKNGKIFHKHIQSEWLTINSNNIFPEHVIFLNGNQSKFGRIDILVDLNSFVGVIEIKSTDWDKINQNNYKKLLNSHSRQVWNYINKYLDIDHLDVCPGIIYPKAPSNLELRTFIEGYFDEQCFQLVWYNEI